ncbi:hypothetical protein F3Y22_tig00112977pilonHSYRG00002 [Hibiscus syriacus]|uniref:Uncharacterized protein n=1 Tax=Hibiscus syriacus TaxID=106335 RepID=A0A6A2WSH3_HIBSY|nr:hypothetical protein F3Y22_tig00112977pilonHSYRG00002 [Hibiscus syriacus]
MQIEKLPLLRFLSCFLFVSQFFQLSHGDVGTAAHYSPPDGVFRRRSNGVPVEQSVHGGRRLDMGQWGIVRETIPGSMHKCFAALDLCSRRDDPGQDYRLCSDGALSILARSTTIVLSETAFGGITSKAVVSINIEFQQ